jgi:hypothetical protein
MIVKKHHKLSTQDNDMAANMESDIQLTWKVTCQLTWILIY